MAQTIKIRHVQAEDFEGWLPLWDGYNAFYGRTGEKALARAITDSTWRRFLTPSEPVFALVASDGTRLTGLVHYLFHRSTSRSEDVCYLQDLYTDPALRGQGIGRALIEAVYSEARAAGLRRVYWQTHSSNLVARQLYDRIAQHQGFLIYTRDL